MAVYWIAANLDKEQYIDPHMFGDGAKDNEWGYSAGGMLTALGKLLSDEDEWKGDRIVIVPDSREDYDRICDSFKDVSEHCRKIIEQDGFMRFVENEDDCWDRVDVTYGRKMSVRVTPDELRLACVMSGNTCAGDRCFLHAAAADLEHLRAQIERVKSVTFEACRKQQEDYDKHGIGYCGQPKMVRAIEVIDALESDDDFTH